jgi:hypothetical protein
VEAQVAGGGGAPGARFGGIRNLRNFSIGRKWNSRPVRLVGMSTQQAAGTSLAFADGSFAPPTRLIRIALQAVATAVAWVLFVAGWIDVARGADQSLVVYTALAMFAVTIISLGITAWWIAHNMAIFRRKGPRRNLRTITFDRQKDFLGQELVADWDSLVASQKVRVSVRGNSKCFLEQHSRRDEPIYV